MKAARQSRDLAGDRDRLILVLAEGSGVVVNDLDLVTRNESGHLSPSAGGSQCGESAAAVESGSAGGGLPRLL